MSAYKVTTASHDLSIYEFTVTHLAHDMRDVCEK